MLLALLPLRAVAAVPATFPFRTIRGVNTARARVIAAPTPLATAEPCTAAMWGRSDAGPFCQGQSRGPGPATAITGVGGKGDVSELDSRTWTGGRGLVAATRETKAAPSRQDSGRDSSGLFGSASAVAVPPSHGHGDAVLITLFLSHVLNYDKEKKGMHSSNLYITGCLDIRKRASNFN